MPTNVILIFFGTVDFGGKKIWEIVWKRHLYVVWWNL